MARNLEVDGMFMRDHRVWVVLMMTRGERRVTVAWRRYGWRDVRNIYSFSANDTIERYWP